MLKKSDLIFNFDKHTFQTIVLLYIDNVVQNIIQRFIHRLEYRRSRMGNILIPWK